MPLANPRTSLFHPNKKHESKSNLAAKLELLERRVAVVKVLYFCLDGDGSVLSRETEVALELRLIREFKAHLIN